MLSCNWASVQNLANPMDHSKGLYICERIFGTLERLHIYERIFDWGIFDFNNRHLLALLKDSSTRLAAVVVALVALSGG